MFKKATLPGPAAPPTPLAGDAGIVGENRNQLALPGGMGGMGGVEADRDRVPGLKVRERAMVEVAKEKMRNAKNTARMGIEPMPVATIGGQK